MEVMHRARIYVPNELIKQPVSFSASGRELPKSLVCFVVYDALDNPAHPDPDPAKIVLVIEITAPSRNEMLDQVQLFVNRYNHSLVKRWDEDRDFQSKYARKQE
jgi:hypothetical protein